ncbi:OadG family transporter subunit [Thalassotalea sp. G2M2-11]|uniref:OadG family transporter subunit n=1 Tax=Thalassotalea sp. G2M2-11 TaxID=2787627 RepID=UPI0019CF95AF|nr:OadG family transporter subunit [Thalassotalea sp. G2M2-11]
MDNLSQLFVEAGTLMLAGMVFVFAFLGILILFINIVLVKLADKYPDPIIQPKSQRNVAKSGNSATEGISPAIVAAISSAVNQYRQKNSKKK